MGQVQKAIAGERCACGKPAKAALVTMLGRVPTCKTPEDYAAEVQEHARLARMGKLGSSGQSGTR